MVDFLGEFWSESLAGLFELVRSFLHMYSCLRQSRHISYGITQPKSLKTFRDAHVISDGLRCSTRCTISTLLRCVVNNDAVLSHAVSRDMVDFFVWMPHHVPTLLLGVPIYTRYFPDFDVRVGVIDG